MTNYLTIPGLGGSGSDHWQTWFESTGSNFTRVLQENWNEPVCAEWVETLNRYVSGFDLTTVVLVAHSLGCITVAHWAKQYNVKIKGSFFVAPADIEFPPYPVSITGFAPIPLEKVPFPSIVVSSTNDVWGACDRVRYFAEKWGSELVSVGDAGHINAASGHYVWKEGLVLLQRLG